MACPTEAGHISLIARQGWGWMRSVNAPKTERRLRLHGPNALLLLPREVWSALVGQA